MDPVRSFNRIRFVKKRAILFELATFFFIISNILLNTFFFGLIWGVPTPPPLLWQEVFALQIHILQSKKTTI